MMRTAVGRFGVLGLILALGACGGDSTNEPSGPVADIAGGWQLSSSNLSNGAIVCRVALTITINQSGGAFNGSYTNGMFACQPLGGAEFINQSGLEGTIFKGTIDSDSALMFNVDTDAILHRGQLETENSMRGSAVWLVDLGLGTGVSELRGSWTAERA